MEQTTSEPHYITKHLQQGIESDTSGSRGPCRGSVAFNPCTARRTIRGFEAMLWLRKGFSFPDAWRVCEQNRLLSVCFGLPEIYKA